MSNYMIIKIVSVGSIKSNNLKQLIFEYQKKINHFVKLEFIEIKESLITDENNYTIINNALQKEGVQMMKYINKKSFVVVNAIEGKQYNSTEFSNFISEIIDNPIYSELVFIIGSSHGVSNEIKIKANALVSFSKMTFPHQLFNLILCEQLYRAFTIKKNIKYHK
ncbi:23S rRNA (pseudouridine(1915)-N(3))-methyltransferase RlmH [Malacoplasma iowae]|uniref:Ribosomal RNA large subunit methyltransferase H n=2 Tax=Malacoplasma iowae TaxID=2116 RepID=A0A084U4D6_MALIO|nr:23S rRNA (pseudouridine(1915)-N(3))-methyltransferase RlmH [Malacoplasma iowae]KFB07822.1 rRNA large subunit m3Psi methyltransferase RlmH [Malacoplasma iowae DK-CPA]WPL36650.1 23S rRNA (pseudouridine(1915)-N(3))-methyltransferase RlmH [Malacoplasma iowae]WPL37876.1 23S rRNA (pseudouridine(1915)-N(3))-methyltransferase RlmH [Malacoplasma iowae]